MKTLISNSKQLNLEQKTRLRIHLLLLPFFFFLLSFILSGSTIIPQKKSLNNNDIRSKRLDVLEKLESGKTVSQEDINLSMGSLMKDYREPGDMYFPEMPSVQDIPPFPDIHPFTGPFYYRYHDGKDHVIISDTDIKAIHKQLNDNLDELRRNIESFRNSEDFMIIHDELQKWNENFRKELNQIKEEIIKSAKETRSKGTAPLLI